MDVAKYIDHTLLKVDTTNIAIEKLCAEAIEHQFCAVCVPPYFLPLTKAALKDSEVKIATVVGFPLGYQSTLSKINEIESAAKLGAIEVDVVWNISAFKSGTLSLLESELIAITQAAKKNNVTIKIIIESGLLNENELKQAAALCIEAAPNFVKTSTGFNGTGAELEKVELLRKWLPSTINIKASGGIKTKEQAIAFINAGATRLGASAGVKIVTN